MGDPNSSVGDGSTNKAIGIFVLGRRNERQNTHQLLHATRSGSDEYNV